MKRKQSNTLQWIILGCLVSVVASCSDSSEGTNDNVNGNTDQLSFHESFKARPVSQNPNMEDGDFRLTLVSSGVSSAFVKLNDNKLFSPRDFHNKSFEKTIHVTLEASNSIEVEVRGSPGDQLCVRIFGVTTSSTEEEFFSRCVDRTAGPPNHVDDTFGLTRVNLAAAGIHAEAATGVTYTDSRLVVGDVTFQPLGVCQGTSSARTMDDYVGPSVVDLMTNAMTPALGSAFLTSGTYCRMDLKLDMLGSEEVPVGIPSDDPIVGTALLAHGTRTSDGTPWALTVNLDDPYQLKNMTGFAIGGNVVHLFLTFDLARWFEGVDLTTAVISNGTILLDSSNNTPMFDAIRTNLVGSSQLYADSDGNGTLEASEIETVDILASGVSSP